MPTTAYFSQMMLSQSEFVEVLAEELRSGILLFSTPLDIVLMLLDVFITAFIFYSFLKIMYETRAWQVLKGLIFVLVLTQVARIAGLQALSFILNSTISILALGFVVLFQPELRQALESVGRNTLYMVVSSGRNETGKSARRRIVNLIEQIVIACENLSESFTGALIVIERQTSMSEIVEQGQAVILKADISAALLEQIFYIGSPLHDGAVLIRGGMIYAARCHIPLSDNYNLRRSHGTRHRAGVGASEAGDAISIIVSEERGTISVSIDGRLYQLDSSDALRTLLYRLLVPREAENGSKRMGRIRTFFQRRREPGHEATRGLFTEEEEEDVRNEKRDRYYHYGMQLVSLILALATWFYAQVMTNPIRTKSFTLPVLAEHTEVLDEYELSYSKESVSPVAVTIKAREKTLAKLDNHAVTAAIDFSDLDLRELVEKDQLSEPVTLDVHIGIRGYGSQTYRVTSRIPSQLKISLFPQVDEDYAETFDRLFPSAD